jgi:glycine/D-amino acid oxidase-like deaminating enzyme
MHHDAHGWWIAEAGAPSRLAPLAGDTSADVVVIGGGYTGLWAAWHLAEAGASVAVLEAGRCGHGPSGRNGGFVSSLALNRPSLAERYGAAAAAEVVTQSQDSVRAIGAWCEEQGVDAWYRAAPHWEVSAAPAQDGVGGEAVDGSEVVELSGEETRARCHSPLFRGAVEVRTGATVHPARLAFGLRDRLAARGVRVFEGSRVRALHSGPTHSGAHHSGVTGVGTGPEGVMALTSSGRVRAGAAIVALNAASGLLAPLRRRLTVASSHIVLTEPVPDVIEALGWTGGEAISDGRALLHYTRTTRDGRILFGWAGGRMACGARTNGRIEVDAEVTAQARADLVRFFPGLAGRAVTHAWGGPIDVSPTHLPTVVTLPGGRAWAAFGYTGNGVGPSHLLGRAMAELATGRDPNLALVDPEPATVPPEPLRVLGAAAIRRALIRKEAAEEQGEKADPLTHAVAGLPRRMGVHIVR